VWLAQTGWRKLERKPLVGPASVIVNRSRTVSTTFCKTTHDRAYHWVISEEQLIL
jgi:hypothetical protein